MKPSFALAVAIAAALALPVAASAQDAPADHSQDAAWHNAQSLALAKLRAADGWRWLEGGVGFRYVNGDGSGGPRPTVQDQVTVHYTGTLVDGTVFDSSVARNEPATFPLGGLIKAWQQAIPLMAVGDRIELAIPADQAYGPQGRGPIPGNATLMFEIELLGIGG